MREPGKDTDKYNRLEKIRKVPRIALGGTSELHENAVHYKHVLGAAQDGEDDDLYMERVRRAEIDPYYERAVNRAVASLFNKPIQLKDDVAQEIAGASGDEEDGIWFNIDGKGNNGDEFFRRVADDSVGDSGMSGVLAEFPVTPDGATRADLANREPYLVHYRGRDILHADRDYVLGKERISRLWLAESPRKLDDGKELKRERELIAPEMDEDGNAQGFVRFVIWEQVEPDGEDYAPISEGEMRPQTEIPFRVYYTGWEGFFDAKPPLLQLAYMNINHTRDKANIRENLRRASWGILFRTIADEEEKKQTIINGTALMYGKIGADGGTPDAKWLDPPTSGSQNYQGFVENSEARMKELGNEVHLRRASGNETATGKAIDSAEARTETEAWSMALKDFIESVLGDMAVYLGDESGGTVVVSPPPRFSERDIQSVEKAMEMREKGVLHPEDKSALEMILEIAKEVFNWPEDFSPEDSAAMNVKLGVLVPGGLESPVEARNREMLTIEEDEEPVMPPEMMGDEEVA